MRNVPVTCILQLNGTSRVFEPLNLGALHNDTHCIAIDALQGRHGTDSGFHDLAPVVEYDSLKRCQREVGEGLQGGRGLPQLKKEWIAPSD
jgi:hypothetical protein